MKKILFILFVFALSLFSEVINISELKSSHNILKQVEVYPSSNSIEDISHIEKQQTSFIKSDKDFINKGFTRDVIWLKFSILNDTNYRVKKVISINNSAINSIILYIKSKKIFKKEVEGIFRTKEFKNILTPYFEILLERNTKKDFYLKLSSKSSALIFKVFIMDKDLLYEKEMNNQFILLLFLGALTTLILYNLFVYLLSKDIVYLYYVLYFFCLSLYYSYYTNMAFYLVDLKVNFLAVYILSFMLISLILLSRAFLNTFKYKKIEVVFKILIVLLVGLILITSKNFYPMDMIILIFLFCLFFILFVAFYSIKQGNKQNVYFVIGWIISIFGYLNFAFYNLGYFSFINIFPYFFELCIFLEALIFSTVLVHKLNTTKRLEKEVEKNKILTKELHHRVKNNMQFIISMYRLKLNNKLDGKLQNDLNELENSIQVMSKTHEMLYKSSDIEYIDTKEYFDILVKDLSQTFDIENIKINIKTTIDLNMEEAMICGIVLNEAITNTLKYAFLKQEGNINISLQKIDTKYLFIIQDDGIGFDYKKVKNTFGLLLMKSIVTCNLNGNFKIDSTNGTKIQIKF